MVSLNPALQRRRAPRRDRGRADDADGPERGDAAALARMATERLRPPQLCAPGRRACSGRPLLRRRERGCDGRGHHVLQLLRQHAAQGLGLWLDSAPLTGVWRVESRAYRPAPPPDDAYPCARRAVHHAALHAPRVSNPEQHRPAATNLRARRRFHLVASRRDPFRLAHAEFDEFPRRAAVRPRADGLQHGVQRAAVRPRAVFRLSFWLHRRSARDDHGRVYAGHLALPAEPAAAAAQGGLVAALVHARRVAICVSWLGRARALWGLSGDDGLLRVARLGVHAPARWAPVRAAAACGGGRCGGGGSGRGGGGGGVVRAARGCPHRHHRARLPVPLHLWLRTRRVQPDWQPARCGPQRGGSVLRACRRRPHRSHRRVARHCPRLAPPRHRRLLCRRTPRGRAHSLTHADDDYVRRVGQHGPGVRAADLFRRGRLAACSRRHQHGRILHHWHPPRRCLRLRARLWGCWALGWFGRRNGLAASWTVHIHVQDG
mmetsp:Transcript_36465/g.76772  ORF Transcript_36465/g.76772 Transcript_36465/m.76772 type:complete len:490 (+) Transcript_36465:583-2052(+)